ncbi:hypothetical protein CRUP_036875, partial [Coryphaenoides rupestris]
SHVTSSHDHTSVHLRPPPTHHRLFPRDPAGSEEPLGGLGSADDPLSRSGTMETERAPLLPPGGRQEDGERSADWEPPFPGCSLVEVLGPPPPYSPPAPGPGGGGGGGGGGAGIICSVCHSSVSLAGKQRHHVVRCGVCSEATPIKSAPVGTKYVRCSCNCLLICKVTSQRIACPRPHCKRVIGLGPVEHRGGGGGEGEGGEDPRHQPPGIRLLCGHCSEAFLCSGSCGRPLVRCPHCLKVSSIGKQYPMRMSLLWFIMFLVTVASLAGIM